MKRKNPDKTMYQLFLLKKNRPQFNLKYNNQEL